ncbi:MAG: site-specific integrase [bacterium]
MANCNPENERIKRQYFEWEKEANGKSLSTVNNMRNNIYLFDEFTKFKSFKHLTKEDVIAFKKYITQKKNQRTNEPVSKTYLLHVSKSLIGLFRWLCCQKGYKQKIRPDDINYFKLSDKDIQIAKSAATKRVPTLNQLELVVKGMPSETEIQKRDKAVFALLILTGCRVKALSSLKLKHISIEDERIEQHPQEVQTKFGKKIITFFFPIEGCFKKIVIDWVIFLKNEKHFDYNAPLFPSTSLTLDKNDQFSRETLDVKSWQSTTSIRNIVKRAFEAAGLPYYNPHSFRDTLVRHMSKLCKSPEEFKAVSQNIGHNNPLTTFTSYGHIEEYNQGEIIKKLGQDKEQNSFTTKEISELKKMLEQKNS